MARNYRPAGTFGPTGPAESSPNYSGTFPSKASDAPQCSITPNGNVHDGGGQPWGSNGYMPKGNLGTRPTASPFNSDKPTGNRTGEG